MSDNKELKGQQDRSRISLSEPYEVRYWCERFNCSEAQLKSAVKAVGNSAGAVSQYFGKQ